MTDTRWTVWLAVIAAACGPKEPAWVADCDCEAGQVCTWGAPAACQDVPEACDAAFQGECDMGLLDDACIAALCGLALDDNGEIAGSYSNDAQCWTSDGSPTQRWMDCDAPMTF